MTNIYKRIKDASIGNCLPIKEFGYYQLNKIRALAAFSPDILSSITYANPEKYLGLVLAGAAGLSILFSLGIVISVILAFLTLSYYKTIRRKRLINAQISP